MLSLIAARGALDAAQVAALAAKLRISPAWLAAEEACEFALAGDAAAAEAMAAARAAFAGAPVDLNLVPASGRRKRLLVADMESTLIRNEMLDELAATIGLGDKVAAITARAMNGELDFRASLRERVALFAGLPVAALERVAGRITLMPGAETLIATMRHHGARTAIVSGGFMFFTRLVRQRLNADHDQGNELEISDGVLAGAVREPILDAAGKADALRRLATMHGLDVADAIAIGDGANDLAMLGLAGLGVAFRAKPRVAAAARLVVTHGDLTALLFLQGYERRSFVAAA